MNSTSHPVGARFLYETEARVLGFNDKILVETVVYEWSPCGRYVRTGNRGSDTTYWRLAASITPLCHLNPIA